MAIEEREAFYPRILVSAKVVEHCSKLTHDPRHKTMVTAQTGRLVINPFAMPFDGPDHLIASFAEQNLFLPEIKSMIESQIAAWKMRTDTKMPKNGAISISSSPARCSLHLQSGVQLGFVVAGYSSGGQLSEVWSIEIKDGQCDPPNLLFGQGVTSVWAGGGPEVFSHLVLGHGQGLQTAMLAAGVTAEAIPGALLQLQKALPIPLVEPPMPIQDAIDFGEFLVHTTTMFTRFKRGAATVGGPIESAAITKHEGFKWVRRKHYFDESLNPKVML